jgi:aminocarboxymuconate-semialdehyde decarboxylase
VTVIDAHAHIIPPEALREAAPDEPWRPRMVDDPSGPGRRIPELRGSPMRNVLHEFSDPERLLAELAGMGVGGAVLSPNVGLLRYDAPAEDCLHSSRVQNDGIASVVRRYPGRVAGLGTVPLQDTALAVGELERCAKIGLRGVEVGTNVGGVHLGDGRFRPLWAACQSLGAVVFVHPTGFPELRDYYMANVVGNPVDTAIAAAHLVLSGTMEALPELKVLLAHGGGVVPELRGRMDHGARVRPEIELPKPPSEYLRRFYYDTITHDPTLLRQLTAWVGHERVLLGSDYPFDMGPQRPAEVVRAARLGAAAEDAVLGGNAARLFGLTAGWPRRRGAEPRPDRAWLRWFRMRLTV